MPVRPQSWISPEEYLDGEALSDERHTYYQGAITAMAGGTLAHGTLAGNLAGELYNALRGRGCRVVGRDVLFRTGTGDLFAYPDLMVICGAVETMTGRPHVVTNPVFVAEVLSPSTAAFDRGEKSHEYRATPSIRQYVLLSSEKPWVEIHTRDDAGFWRITETVGLDGECAFTGIACTVPMAALYEGVLAA